MPDGAIAIAVIIGFAFIAYAGSHLGAGSVQAFAGLFAARDARDWPHGVQEGDAPRFAVWHLDELRPGQPEVIATSAADDDSVDGPPTELLDLGSRRLGTPRD